MSSVCAWLNLRVALARKQLRVRLTHERRVVTRHGGDDHPLRPSGVSRSACARAEVEALFGVDLHPVNVGLICDGLPAGGYIEPSPVLIEEKYRVKSPVPYLQPKINDCGGATTSPMVVHPPRVKVSRIRSARIPRVYVRVTRRSAVG